MRFEQFSYADLNEVLTAVGQENGRQRENDAYLLTPLSETSEFVPVKHPRKMGTLFSTPLRGINEY
jgi:hypothetical protein